MGLVRWVDSVVAGLGGNGGVESVVLVWVCDCFSDGFVVGCLGLGGSGSGMWVFFLGNLGGDRRVWLSFGGWCCVGLPEREKNRGNGDEREERNQIFNIILLRKIIIKNIYFIHLKSKSKSKFKFRYPNNGISNPSLFKKTQTLLLINRFHIQIQIQIQMLPSKHNRNVFKMNVYIISSMKR